MAETMYAEAASFIAGRYDQFIADCFRHCGVEIDLKDFEKWKSRIRGIDSVSWQEWYLDDELLFVVHKYITPIMTESETCKFEYKYIVDFMKGENYD